MRRSEKGLKVATFLYMIFGGVLTYGMRYDRAPAWMQDLPDWVQSVIGITAIGSFLVLMAYYTLDRTRSYVCRSCGYKIDVRKEWLKSTHVFFWILGGGMLLFALLMIVFLGAMLLGA